jgi:dihydropteroate synthase
MTFLPSSQKLNHPGMQLARGVFLGFSCPLVMSIVNCTPDSFYPPSRTFSPEEAAEMAIAAEAEGADIVDFGAESTRPGAVSVDIEEEIRRLIPALRLFRKKSSLPVSVDTRNALTARYALDEGADIINDVSAFQDEAMINLCAERKAAVVLMHSAGAEYGMAAVSDLSEITTFLLAAAEKAIAGGIEKGRIIVDPGFGFNKNAADDLLLLNQLATIKLSDYPLLVGLSRKRFIGAVSGRDPEWRLPGTIAANVLAVIGGADIIRVHDTAAAVDAVKIVAAVQNAQSKAESKR